jgi:hypothetical protein
MSIKKVAIEYLDKEDVASDYIGRDVIELAAKKVDDYINRWADKLGEHTWDVNVAEGEHKSRDGFMSFQEGNVQGSFFFDYTYETPDFPKPAADKLDELRRILQDYVAEQIYEEEKETIDKLLGPVDDPNWETIYYALNDLAASDSKQTSFDPGAGATDVLQPLLDKLDEAENAALSDGDEGCVAMCQLEVYFYNKEGKKSFTVIASVNWENPYFRTGSGNEYFKQSKDVGFTDINDLDGKLDTEIASVMSEFL